MERTWFAGMFWSVEANLSLTQFRAYDPELGRWLSRDPLKNAELKEGPNLYAYVANDPVNLIDPLGGGSSPFERASYHPLPSGSCAFSGSSTASAFPLSNTPHRLRHRP
jgi:RHS repeat-associated protein